MHILLVEDDRETVEFVSRGLREHGHSMVHCGDARSGLVAASTDPYDVIIFDRLLPGMDGIDATRVLRESGVEAPILVLTALAGIQDRVDGLEAGADDYMVKPFAFSELLARLKALTRRQTKAVESLVLAAGPLQLDRATRQVTREGRTLDLLPREFQLLEFFLQHQGQLVTRTMLLEQVWGYHFDPKTSLVQTHVSRLRSKVDKPFDSELIRTVRGRGYILEAS